MESIHRIECPHCGFAGKTRTAPADGKAVRCTKCGESFVYRTPAPPVVAPPVAAEVTVFKAIPEPTAPSAGDWVEARSLRAIEDRMRRLEKWNRVLAATCAVLFALGVAGVVYPRVKITVPKPAANPDMIDKLTVNHLAALDLAVHSLHLVDLDGNRLAELGVSQQEPRHGLLKLHRVGEKSKTVIAPSALFMTDVGDNPRFLMTIDDKFKGGKGASLQINDARGEGRITLNALPDSGKIAVYDVQGNARIGLGVNQVKIGGVNRESQYFVQVAEDGSIQNLLP